jgi:hypothetical protein
MSGKRAKLIRKLIYGEIYSPKHREYEENLATGKITADVFRQNYQKAKRDWVNKDSRLWRNYG